MELLDILNTKDPVAILRHLDQNGQLAEIFPELVALKASGANHKDNFEHTLGVLQNVIDAGGNDGMRLVALFHDLGKASTKKFIDGKWTFHMHEEVSAHMLQELYDRFHIPSVLRMYVTVIVSLHGRPKSVADDGVSDSAVRRLSKDAYQYFDDLIKFAKCDMTTKNFAKRKQYTDAFNDLQTRKIRIDLEDEEAKWRPPITGHDIMALGIKGRNVALAKDDVIAKIKSGALQEDRDACLAYLDANKNLWTN